MTFNEWLEKFYKDGHDGIELDQLMDEYVQWKRAQADNACSYCVTGEIPEENKHLDKLL